MSRQTDGVNLHRDTARRAVVYSPSPLKQSRCGQGVKNEVQKRDRQGGLSPSSPTAVLAAATDNLLSPCAGGTSAACNVHSLISEARQDGNEQLHCLFLGEKAGSQDR